MVLPRRTSNFRACKYVNYMSRGRTLVREIGVFGRKINDCKLKKILELRKTKRQYKLLPLRTVTSQFRKVVSKVCVWEEGCGGYLCLARGIEAVGQCFSVILGLLVEIRTRKERKPSAPKLSVSASSHLLSF